MLKKMAFVPAIVLMCGFTSSHVLAEGYVGGAFGKAEMETVDDTSFKIFGGHRAGAFGFEAAYHDLGKQSESFGGQTASIEATGIELSAVGYLAAGNSFDLFGKIGMLLWDADFSLTGFPTVSDDGSDIIFGVGGQFKPTKHFSIRFEYQMFDLGTIGGDLDTDILSIGAAYHF